MRLQRLSRCAHEQGSVTPLVIAALTALLLALALTIDFGIAFLGKTQLQRIADTAARAAMAALAAANPDANTETVVANAVAQAKAVGEATGAIQGGVTPSDIQVEMGTFDFSKSTDGFSAGADRDSSLPSAVRVTVRRTAGSNSGAFQRFSAALAGEEGIQVSARSTAALSCRNIVLIIDVSGSFAESIGTVQTAVRRTLRDLAVAGVPDQVGLVVFRNEVVRRSGGELVTSRVLTNPSDDDLQDQVDTFENNDVRCLVPPGIPVPSCAGTDMAGALDAATELFDTGNDRCENIAVILTDGEPCAIREPFLTARARVLGNPLFVALAPLGEQRGGGSTVEETQNAAERLSEVASLSTIAINTEETGFGPLPIGAFLRDGRETCPVVASGRPGLLDFLVDDEEGTRIPLVLEDPDDNIINFALRPTTSNEAFLTEIASGLGQRFDSDLESDPLSQKMNRALANVPPVTVE